MSESIDTAITVGAHCYKQANSGESMDESGNGSINIVYKGPYSELEMMMGSLCQGKKVEDGARAKSWQLNGLNGGLGLLTITCAAEVADTAGTDGEGNATSTQTPIKDTWSIHNVRNDRSIYAYCGDSPGANAQRADIEQWAKEPDGDLAALFQYREADGTVRTLSSPSQQVASKIAKGVESVIRFYPAITRKRVYTAPPDECLDNVGFIDSPPVGGTSISPNAKKPSGLSQKLATYQWLKIQDDVDEQSDGNWVRTESWWGALASEGGWDENLYGASRWAMPADLAVQQGAN